VTVPAADVTALLGASEQAIIDRTSDFVRSRLGSEPTGHDWWHAERVRRLARHIALAEGADVLVVEAAALLHDLADAKFIGAEAARADVVREWLLRLPAPGRVVDAVLEIVPRVSYRGAGVADEPLSLEGQCVRDADRLDAMGAVGVARVFAYGGHVGRKIHDPDESPTMHSTAEAYYASIGTSINHFHEKLLLLQGRLATATGQQLGRRRHDFMLRFLGQFYWESDGSDIDV
jgi:uncharacterized protein